MPVEVIISQQVDNPATPPGLNPPKVKQAIRVHSFSRRKGRKNKLNHLITTAHLRDEPDLNKFARAVVLLAEQIAAEKRKQREQGSTPTDSRADRAPHIKRT